MPYIYKNSSIDLDYFTDNNASGGEGGSDFHFITLNEGAILKKIRAWKRDWRIGGVEIWMTDGSTFKCGTTDSGDWSEFRFKKGEVMVSLNVQASGPYSSIKGRRRLGGIALETSKGRKWEIYASKVSDDGRYFPDIGSGVCCGVFGGAGDAVDRFGFALLRPIERSLLLDVRYPQLNMEIVASKPDVVAHQIFHNGSNIDQTFTMSGSKSVTTIREWTLSTELSMTVSLEVTAGVPGVVSTTAGYSWTVGITSSHKVSSSKTQTETWTWPLKCPSFTSILGKATLYADNIDTPYEGEVEMRLRNGKIFKHKVKGVYRGLNARSGTVTVETLGPAESMECSTQQYQTSPW